MLNFNTMICLKFYIVWTVLMRIRILQMIHGHELGQDAFHSTSMSLAKNNPKEKPMLIYQKCLIFKLLADAQIRFHQARNHLLLPYPNVRQALVAFL